jgi:hypothetical protein
VAGALIAGLLQDGGIMSAGQTGSQTQFAISGLALIAIAVLYPNGISGALYAGRDRVRRRLTRGGPVSAGATVEPLG